MLKNTIKLIGIAVFMTVITFGVNALGAMDGARNSGDRGLLTVNDAPGNADGIVIVPNKTKENQSDLHIAMGIDAAAISTGKESPFSLIVSGKRPFARSGKFIVILKTTSGYNFYVNNVQFTKGSASINFDDMTNIAALPAEDDSPKGIAGFFSRIFGGLFKSKSKSIGDDSDSASADGGSTSKAKSNSDTDSAGTSKAESSTSTSSNLKVPNTNGSLTVTGLDSHNGKYAIAYCYTANERLLIGVSNFETSGKVDLGHISGGKAVLKIWEVKEGKPESTLVNYNKSDKEVTCMIGILHKNNLEAFSVEPTTMEQAMKLMKEYADVGLTTVNFTGGRATGTFTSTGFGSIDFGDIDFGGMDLGSMDFSGLGF